MELEDDLRKLRLGGAPAALRARILREARTHPRSSLVPPWFAALERHWLYPGRVPVMALAAAWLVIASLRFATPATLLPGESHLVPLTNQDLARFEYQRGELLTTLRELEDEPLFPSRQPNLLPPRS